MILTSRQLPPAILAALLCWPGSILRGGETEKADVPRPLVSVQVRTTAYTHTEDDHLAFGKKTALGTDLRYTPEYHSVAADWSRFPLGTKFKIRGYDRVFVVDDYGKALVDTSTIDIYFDTKARMNNWGVRRVTIDVLEFGSFHESRKILAERGTFPHCLKMLASMTTDDWWKTYQR